MRSRCHRKGHKHYLHYGGRGIKIAEEWNKFEIFLKDMGERPEGKTLDRIDNDGNYCRENCRWATISEQLRNRSNTVKVKWMGKEMCVADWEKEVGISRKLIYWRLKKGWPIEKVLS